MAVSLVTERQLWAAGARVVAGIDEVGRGALAGPASVGVLAMELTDTWPHGLADSKKLTPLRRAQLAAELVDVGVSRAVAHADPADIDRYGIVDALRRAAVAALAALDCEVDAIILDGKHNYLDVQPDFGAAASGVAGVGAPVTMVVGGDDLCVAVAGASILAKVARDELMVAAHEHHPVYDWASNKGYGSPTHMAALRDHGPSPLHRHSFSLPQWRPKRA